MIRLNKFISNSGLCTRREADDFIVDGRVHVDNQIVTTLGYKVSIDSEVRVDNKIIVPYSFQYVVLNKPIDFNINSKKIRVIFRFTIPYKPTIMISISN